MQNRMELERLEAERTEVTIVIQARVNKSLHRHVSI